jgi:ribosome-binding factor A
MSKIKCERIASDMIRIISNILANGSRDELLKTVTITGCTVSNDLSYAKVYFTSTSNLTPKEMEKEMKEASGFIRHELAEKIDIRHTPELNFVYDESIEYGNRIESIIKEINNK